MKFNGMDVSFLRVFSGILISGIMAIPKNGNSFDASFLCDFSAILRTFARKCSNRWNFLKFLLQEDNELLVPDMKKNWGSPSSFQR